MRQDIVFQGLHAPLRLEGAAEVAALFPAIAAGWPHDLRVADPGRQPFFTIRGTDGARYLCESHIDPAPPRTWDALNAACDAVASLAQALPAEDRRILCLHAAGVAVNGQLLVFPNIRRAGKSTLAAALAQAGHAVFSDDVVPLFQPGGAAVEGLALGIAPRLRLPLPESAGQGFRDWVAAVSGPGNRQYRYLTLAGQPPHGESLPVAAFVLLDRQDAASAAELIPVPPEAAMDALLHQNFTRDRHSGEVLALMAGLLAARPTVRLVYSGLEAAVKCLTAAFPYGGGPPMRPGTAPAVSFGPALVDQPVALPPPGGALVQRPGSLARPIGETLYLADPEGKAIHKMDPLAAVIWDILEEPVTRDELAALLAESFPETGADRLAADLDGLLGNLAAWGLVGAA